MALNLTQEKTIGNLRHNYTATVDEVTGRAYLLLGTGHKKVAIVLDEQGALLNASLTVVFRDDKNDQK